MFSAYVPADFVAVRPVVPVAGYIGSKRNLAKRIGALIERTPHSSYAESIVGIGGIFLRRTTRPNAEAINDISGDIITLFRCLAEHYPIWLTCCVFASQAAPSLIGCLTSIPIT